MDKHTLSLQAQSNTSGNPALHPAIYIFLLGIVFFPL